MKTFNIKWICIILLISNSFPLADNKFLNPMSPNGSTPQFNKYGVQFYLINGISFALKTRASYPHTWRLLFDLSGSFTNSSSEYRETFSNDTYQESESERGGHDFNFSLSFQYNHFFKVKNYFDPYVGIGPLIRYGIQKGKYESKEMIGGDVARSDETTNIYLGIGVHSSIGIESSLFSHLSLFSELNLSYAHEWTKWESNSNIFTSDSWRKYEVTGTTSSLDLNSIKLGLIVYF